MRKQRTEFIQFARRLRQLRKQSGLTQEKLAERAQLDRAFISELERARKNATLITLQKLAAALEVEPFELLKPPDEESKEV